MTATLKEVKYERPWLAPYQLSAIFAPERYVCVEASSKSGKTAGCIVWLIEQAIQGRAGQNFWWIAPIREQAKIAFSRIRRAIPRWSYEINESTLTVTLANGAILWFKSADKPDSLYGEDVQAAVIDEASRCKEDSWFAVRSTLTATRGKLRIIGNVKGRKNWAYRLARQAESGEPDMHFAKITAYDAIQAGILDAAEIEDARKRLPESVFKELYLAEPSNDEGNPFGMSAIRAGIRPLSTLAPVAFGVDLAKSVDWTVIIGLDMNGDVCHLSRFQKPWQETLTEIKRIVGGVPALVDSTGVGDPIFENLERSGTNYTGYKFTAPSKQQLMEGLAVAIQQNEIGFPEGVIVNELEVFEYEYTRIGVRYSAPQGLHDDCVVALGLAVKQKGTPRLYAALAMGKVKVKLAY